MREEIVVAEPPPRNKAGSRAGSGRHGFLMASTRFARSIVPLSIWTAALIAALATALVSAAERSWPGDMIVFFRPQLALAVLLLFCAAVWLRRWLASAALGALLVLNGLPLFVIGVPTAASATTPNLRILSANLLFDNPEPARFGAVVAALSPDIIVTQEARFDWPGVLKALPGYPHLVGPDISKWNGNLVLSRYPLRARLVADMPPSGYGLGGGYAVRVEVDLPDRTLPLVVYAIHAPTPRSFAGWQARNRYLDVVAERIAAEPEDTPIVLAGDWNTPVWSPAYGRTLLLSGLEATERSAWPPASRLFASFGGVDVGTPIDHVAVSRGIDVAGLFTGPDFGSDHLPVVADLRLP
jgi:endonuclease/exonuclease/phosphatase (EEP) superfamily protein YafD